MKSPVYKNSKMPLEDRIQDLLSQMTLDEKLEQVHGSTLFETAKNKRLGIPGFNMTDGPHGVRWGQATAFPTGVAMASTWNPDLIEKLGQALGRETKAQGRDVLLGPCVNIHRTPLGGRNFESFGEDPFLTSRITVPYIRGVQSVGVAASVKHFAVNNQETERMNISAEIDEAALQEIYLPSFRAAVVEADVWTVMSAYNRVNGDYCGQNRHLLQDVLKGDWNFRGLVVSDWGGTHDTLGSGLYGLDIEMPGPGYYFGADLKKAIEQKRVPAEALDDKVRRVLRIKFLMGLMDSGVKRAPKKKFLAKASAVLARKIGAEAVVLLKNDRGTLPLGLSKTKTLALIGPNANIARLGGGGSSFVNAEHRVSPLDGIRGLVKKQVRVLHSPGCVLPDNLLTLPTESITCQTGQGQKPGLAGDYFDNDHFEGDPAVSRVDLPSRMSRGLASPFKNTEGLSVRWQGTLRVPAPGLYALGLICPMQTRLTLDGQILVEGSRSSNFLRTRLHEKSVELEKDRDYALRLEYIDKGGSALVRVKLGWRPGWDMVKEAVATAKKTNVVVLCVGMAPNIEREGFDLKSMSLPGDQVRLIQEVAGAAKKTIVVIFGGVPVDMEPWLDRVDAVIQAWYPGQEGGHVLADVLFGKVNPSGKLPVSFPKKLADSPSSAYYPGKDGKVRYGEGLFVGYRYFDTQGIKALFPFGYGLSFTIFAFSNLVVRCLDPSPHPRVRIRMDIKNSGSRPGQEVVQLYVGRADPGSRPKKELKGFQKVNLKKGQKKTLTFDLDSDAFSFFDTRRDRWALHPGEYKIHLGSSSENIHLTGTVRI